MWFWAPLPFAVHALAMVVDEAWFHRRRGLPRWERLGHPADTATVLGCWILALAMEPARGNLPIYIAAAVLSTLFVTKDEWIHAGACTGGEMWLHAFLFAMHPVLLGVVGFHWQAAGAGAGHAFFGAFLAGQAAVTALFLLWQLIYWNGPWAPPLPAEAAR